MTHGVKISPTHFEEVLSGRKKFEIRFNDRNYKIGDVVVLSEYLGVREFPRCPDRHCCDGGDYDEKSGTYNPCPLDRESCLEYRKDLFSGRSVSVLITDIFDIGDVFPGYVAFNFNIRCIREK